MSATPTTVRPSQRPVKPRPWLVTIPGDKARYCTACRTVYHTDAGACDCGNKDGLVIERELSGRRSA